MPSTAPLLRLATAACALLALAGTAPLAAQAPFLVKDINPSAASDPTQLVTIDDTVYFVADDGASGLELWKSDGTVVGTMLVADICPNACSSYPDQLTASGQTLFFVADDGVHGRELWKSDGAGTAMVADLRPAPTIPGIADLTAFNGEVFFRAHDGVTGYELWKSDGTAGGTQLVLDIQPGSTSSSPDELTAVGDTLYFAATTFAQGREVWKSDGTGPGTQIAKDINLFSGSSFPANLTAVGDTLFFSAWDGFGRELWKIDGAVGNRVKDIYGGSGSSHPSDLTDAGGGTLYFVADDGQTGAELWKSDGTDTGTVLVKDIRPGSESSGATRLVFAEGTLFLTADDGLVGEELWKSDGSQGGTRLVLDINPGATGSSPCELEAVAGTVYFSADDGIAGAELWASDGTQAGTNLVADLEIGPPSSSPTEPVTAPATFFFAADGASAGRELWALQTATGAPALALANQFAQEWALIDSTGNTFTLTVSNTGSATAEDVQVTALVDSRLTVTQVTPASECSASSGQAVDCTFLTLDPEAERVITVTFDVPDGVSPAADVPNVADADALNADPVQATDYIDLLAPCEGMPVDNYLTGETIDTPGYLAEACNMVSATDVVVTGTGDATLRAGGRIELHDGFVVEAGGSLTTLIDPLLGP